MCKNKKTKVIPSRQPLANIIIMALFGVPGTIVCVATIILGKYDESDAVMLPFSMMMSLFFLYTTFLAIRINIRLENGYYQDLEEKTYHYKGDEEE